jgi:hypothetical protein
VTRWLPVVLVDFEQPEGRFRHPASAYSALLFGDPNAPDAAGRITMRSYFLENSQGLLDLRGRVLGWYRAPGRAADYPFQSIAALAGVFVPGRPGGPIAGAGAAAEKPAAFGQLLEFALTAADPEVDFGLFDNDGPDGRPNSGDDDGAVDTVIFLWNGLGAECGGAETAPILSHQFRYDSSTLGHKDRPFRTRAVRRDALGEARLDPDGTEQHIVVRDYIFQAGLSCGSPGGPDDKKAGPGDKRAGPGGGQVQPPKLIEIGRLCHLYSHGLGLPDLHDRTPKERPDSSGVGVYCLMGYGMDGGDRAHPHPERPVALSAWCKSFLGWADVVTIEKSGTYEFQPVPENNRVYRIAVPGTDGLEYFLIEYRSKDWTDPVAARTNWDADLPGSGLLVWHVDERVGSDLVSWPSTPPDLGQNDAASRPEEIRDPGDERPNRYREKHALVALVQADGKFELEQGRSFGDPGDFFRGPVGLTDSPTLIRSTRGYNSDRSSRFAITDIDLTRQSFRVKFESGGPEGAAPPTPGGPPLRGSFAEHEVTARRLLDLDRAAREEFRRVAVRNRYTEPRPPPPDPRAAAFDWRRRGVVTPVRDDGLCGGAWAFAALAAFESAYALRNGWLIDTSEQQVINCAAGEGCDGGCYRLSGIFSL